MEAGATEIVNVCLPSRLGDRWAGDDVCGLVCGQKAKQFPLRGTTSVTFVVLVGSSGFY